MWKFVMIVALVCAGIQWILFGIDIFINGHFNFVVFTQAILWTAWGIFCFLKHRKEI